MPERLSIPIVVVVGGALVCAAWGVDLFARGLPFGPSGLLTLLRSAVSPWVVAAMPMVFLGVEWRISTVRPAEEPGSAGPWDGQALADGALEAMFLVQRDGSLQAANLAAERMFGRTESEMVGSDIRSLLPDFDSNPSDLGRTRRTMDRVVLGVEWDFDGVHRTGRRFPVRVSYARTTSGLVVRVRPESAEERVATEADKTSRGLRKSVEDVRAELRAKNTFIASMSHELRTPLNAVIGYAEMLAEEIEDEVAQEDLGRIERSGRYLLRLINNILDLSKIEAGKLSVVRQHVTIDDVMADLRDTLAPMAREHQNRLSVTVEPGLSVVFADPVRLRQVLINLGGNAVKFTQEGDVDLEVRSTEHSSRGRTQHGVVFAVRDTGPGMSPEKCSTLFEAYASSDLQREAGGTGLGLVISRHLVEAMGGRLSVESELGVGTTFEVFLPTPALSRVTLIPTFSRPGSAPIKPDPRQTAAAMRSAISATSETTALPDTDGGTEPGQVRTDPIPVTLDDGPTAPMGRFGAWFTRRPARLSKHIVHHLNGRGWNLKPTADSETFAREAPRSDVLVIDLASEGGWDLAYTWAARCPTVCLGVDADVSPALSTGAREVLVEPAPIERWNVMLDRACLQARPIVMMSEDARLLEVLRERFGQQVVIASELAEARLVSSRPAVAIVSAPPIAMALQEHWPDLPCVIYGEAVSESGIPRAAAIELAGEEGLAQVLHAVSVALMRNWEPS